MGFNLFGRNKDIRKEEIDKKFKIAVTPFPQKLQSSSINEDEIDIILGENIKKSKYTQSVNNYEYKD